MKTKKSLGQHFLKSEKALEKIIEVSNLEKGEIVLEIGPGQGALTERLLETGAKVIAVEKDDNLFGFLKEKFKNEIVSGKLELVHGDILDFDTSRLEHYKLVANIPYNITGAIIRKFLETGNQPKLMVLLVQKEVAKRIVAVDGKESILSISVKAYGTPHYIETVKAGSFAPMPQVDSAILLIDKISHDTFLNMAQNNNLETKFPSGGRREWMDVEKRFFEIVRAGFASKRKKLISNLRAKFDTEALKKAFFDLNINENARAEDLSLETWQNLGKSVLK